MGKRGRRRNCQQTQYQDEGQEAQDCSDHQRGIHKPQGFKQNHNPFEKHFRPHPPYGAMNPNPNRNPFAKLHHNPHPNPTFNPPCGQRAHTRLNQTYRGYNWENHHLILKRRIIQALNTVVRQINIFLPDNDAYPSSDSDTEEEMDWQPEHEVIIPQPFEVVYPWPAGIGNNVDFERPPWGDGGNEDVELKLEKGTWMANSVRRRTRYEAGRKRDWDEESMPDSP
ncbi:uncharacterized protein PAC_17244 [Phialocephala subalpina]|uniref:Uncharacterized protein n=1 Tax=Phialocephala subalpina TaxID=576137 RepID=A0A1L7XQR1_9HELO|nr:uncharacterized protein PAC_17244 [Phialocephala subalpina]